MKLTSEFLVKPHTKVRLSRLSPSETPGFREETSALPVLQKHRKRLDELQEVLYASQQQAVLVLFQGMDTSGKDGVIRSIFSGLNPQGVQVAAFKKPTALEDRHDFLWRCHQQVPPRGMIGIFNRSHYEDVLWPRVHGAMTAQRIRDRLARIDEFESMLAENHVTILKFFLHISREEQTRRLQARIDEPNKHWKLDDADFTERKFWPKYTDCYQEILSHTSHNHAPWFVIPANHKWFRNVAISQILADALESLKLTYPKPAFDPKGIDLGKESLSSMEKKVKKRHNKKAVNLDSQTVTYGRQ